MPKHEAIEEPGRRGKKTVQNLSLNDSERISLCEVLDRVLNKGAVVVGDVTISVADVDLIYLGLRLVLTSMETARKDTLQGPMGIGSWLDV